MKPTAVHVPKKAGIWIDQEKAYIFLMVGNSEPVMHKIKSEVESKQLHLSGQNEDKSRSANYIAGERDKKQHRQEHERSDFFKEVMRQVMDADYIYIFGPGPARHGLINTLQEEKQLKGSILPSEKAGRMTLNQMRAKVEEYFTPEHLKKTVHPSFHN